MNYAIALILVLLFTAGFRFARIVPVASDVLARTRVAVGVIADRSKSDDEKERAAREAALVLFGRFFVIVALTAAALVPSIVFLLIAVQAGIADETKVMDALLSPWIVVTAIALFIVECLVRR
jgi:hypothetical protein